jgi:two-component system phosphate regulon sensor histidine kinase PhoR
MKSRFLIGLSALALLVLVSVQYVFITETYSTKKRLIDARYGALVRNALRSFQNDDYNFAFDSVLYVMDKLALEYLFADPDTMQSTYGEVFYEILTHYREPEWYVRDYVQKAGEDPDFTFQLQLRELFLVDMGFEKQVYPDNHILEMAPPEAILAGSYTHERNFYRISYDVFINFRNLTRMVLNEMRLILILSIFTLVLVFSVFYVTLRNMLLQKRLSEMKTDFINNMTHELKTPLSTISVASSSLENKRVIQQERRVEELSGLIKKQNKHLSELIDRILDIHIWEKDQVRLKKHPVMVEEWIRGLSGAFVLEQGQACQELDLRVNFPPGSFSMDEVHMSTAVNNLLSNAVKYGHSPCRILLSVTVESEQLVLSVSDNGPGIPKEELKHIFEKFYRGRESKQRVIKGLGLGLYYVKQIVEAHGGRISVESASGKGSRFIIRIPLQHGNITG